MVLCPTAMLRGQATYSDTSNGLVYTLSENPNIATVTGHSDNLAESIHISGTISVDGKEYEVRLGEGVFKDCTSISKVNLLDLTGLTALPSSEFAGCTNLNTVALPASVTEIGDNAFDGCVRFDPSGVIRDGLVSIGECAFRGCYNLADEEISELRIPGTVKSVGDGAFYNCKIHTVAIYPLDQSDPEETLDIGSQAFYNNKYPMNYIYCGYFTPPVLRGTDFAPLQFNATLFVNPGRDQAYAAANGWKNFSGGIWTGIDGLYESIQSTFPVYNLKGVQVGVASDPSLSAFPSGIYIVNGRKVAR